MSGSLVTEPFGPGCDRHKGDPHNLCESCWELEPDADRIEAKAAALVEYGNSLPEGVTTEAFGLAGLLRHIVARRRRV